jgi:DNA repair protein RadC
MAPKKKKETKETQSVDSKTMFDHLNAIYTDKSVEYFDGLTEKDLKTYNQYILNRFMSMNPMQAVFVDEIQQFGAIPDRAHYQYFADALPMGKRYDKYVKPSKKVEYKEWIIEMVSKHYEVSKKEAVNYLDIYYQQNKNALKELCEFYGKTDKEIKELKL